jgi:hypothetical protein
MSDSADDCTAMAGSVADGAGAAEPEESVEAVDGAEAAAVSARE